SMASASCVHGCRIRCRRFRSGTRNWRSSACSSCCGTWRRPVMLSMARRSRSQARCTSTSSSSSLASCRCDPNQMRLIVDGYNVIHAWPSLKRLLGVSLEAARDKLVERLSVFGLVTETDVTVVFDAHHSKAMANAEEQVEGVHVVFTRKGHSADHVIE